MRDVFYNREWDYLFVKCGEGKPDRSLDENGATLLSMAMSSSGPTSPTRRGWSSRTASTCAYLLRTRRR